MGREEQPCFGKSVEAQKINLAVDKIRVEVNRRYQELMQTDGYVTAAKLKDAYLGIGVKQETLLKLFEQHNAEFEKKVGHSRAQGTFTRYRTVCNHIREFLPHSYKREDIPLKELNLTFINDFEYFLRTEKKCRTNTVWGYMIALKHIVSIARNDGLKKVCEFWADRGVDGLRLDVVNLTWQICIWDMPKHFVCAAISTMP